MKLFRVISRVNGIEFEKKRYDNVLFNWFVSERSFLPADTSISILNYEELTEPEKKNGRDYLSELFTRLEAESLKSFLDRTIEGTTTIEDVKLPVPDNVTSYASFKIRRGIGFTDLFKRKNYPLEFKVRGLFNINEAEESIRPDERPTIISKTISGEFDRKDD